MAGITSKYFYTKVNGIAYQGKVTEDSGKFEAPEGWAINPEPPDEDTRLEVEAMLAHKWHIEYEGYPDSGEDRLSYLTSHGSTFNQ